MQFVDPNERVSHEKNHAEAIEQWATSNEALKDAVTRRDYFEQLSDRDFFDLVEQTASLVRTGDASKRQHFDGEAVSLAVHDVPDQREKESLLTATWETAQRILRNRELSDEDALQRAGLTVGGGLLLTHPFVDGNGRTSRALSYILINGTEKQAALEEILAGHNGGSKWNIVPDSGTIIPRIKTEYASSLQPNQIEWEDHFVGEGEDAYGGDIINNHSSDRIIRQFVENADDETKRLIELASTHEEGKTTLDANQLLKVLADSPRAMEYGKELGDYKRQIRADRVLDFLATMENNQRYHLSHNIERRLGYLDAHRERLGKELFARVEAGEKGFTLAEQNIINHRLHSAVYDAQGATEDAA